MFVIRGCLHCVGLCIRYSRHGLVLLGCLHCVGLCIRYSRHGLVLVGLPANRQAHDEWADARRVAAVESLAADAKALLERQEKAAAVSEHRAAKQLVSTVYPFKAMGVKAVKGPLIGER